MCLRSLGYAIEAHPGLEPKKEAVTPHDSGNSSPLACYAGSGTRIRERSDMVSRKDRVRANGPNRHLTADSPEPRGAVLDREPESHNALRPACRRQECGTSRLQGRARSCSTTVQRETEMAPSTQQGGGGITGGYRSAAFIHGANPGFFHLSFIDTKELLCSLSYQVVPLFQRFKWH